MFGFVPKVPEISAEEVMQKIDMAENLVIVDVRTPGEFERGNITGSINIPLDKITSIIEEVNDKQSTLYVYCLSGSRSVMAADELIKMGYKNTYNMKSGLLAWRANKYPLSKKA